MHLGVMIAQATYITQPYWYDYGRVVCWAAMGVKKMEERSE